jgi:actin related protein 2/3 complex, subunit 1A/1B
VSSGAKVVMICFFDPANDWWISKVSKKHKSTALTAAWHPSSMVLASVATDYRCRVISAHLEDLDGASPEAAPAIASATTQFGALPEAGEVITEFETTRAWLNDCAWSQSGHCLAFVGHDSLLHVVTFAKEPTEAPTIQSIKCPTLPDMRVLFLSDSALVTAGHAQNPQIFIRGADGFWRFACYVDRKPEAGAGKAAAATGGVAAARAMFASKVSKGQAAGSGPEDAWTKHQNAITYLKPYAVSSSECGGGIKGKWGSGGEGAA